MPRNCEAGLSDWSEWSQCQGGDGLSDKSGKSHCQGHERLIYLTGVDDLIAKDQCCGAGPILTGTGSGSGYRLRAKDNNIFVTQI